MNIFIIINQIRSELRIWSAAVKLRDNYTCAQCGIQSKLNMHAHHIIPKLKNLLLAFDIDNGITLCKSCHMKLTNTGKKRPHLKLYNASQRGVKKEYVTVRNLLNWKNPLYRKRMSLLASQVHSGKIISELHKLKISLKLKGVKCPSRGRPGIKRSLLTKTRMSIAAKLKWEKIKQKNNKITTQVVEGE